MTTLLILSLLAIVAVSYLSSMTAERQTADAYGSKTVAEQAAQTGVDNATAMLAQSFRDFPDSATVWDTTQTANSGTPFNAAVVGGTNNEGTNLYLRAVPSTQDASAYAVALPTGVTYTNGGTSYAANDPKGNDPNNPACQNFVLPLISGVPNGQAKLVSQKGNIFANKMDLSVSDPAKQNWTDLNVRRTGTDVQGIIGSPPDWTAAGVTPKGPKPARAYWVDLKGIDGLATGRYAFWIEDESFRLNTSLAGGPSMVSPSATPPSQPVDNTAQPTPYPSPAPPAGVTKRSVQPGDLMLSGTLAAAGYTPTDADNHARTIMATRASYPAYFFPDPMAFGHAYDGATPPGNLIDRMRYLTTNQSGSLNLSRHGSQRLNLNAAVSTPSATLTATAITAEIQKQVNQLVQTMEFHLPYLGERFYRTGYSALNDATQVPGSPYAGTVTAFGSPSDGSHSQIYYHKVAANLRDYVDTDGQPTIIGSDGAVMGAPINATLGDTTITPPASNIFWAQGKESAPYIQEVAVRYRPVVTTAANATPSNPKGHYKMNVDYYIEFWNMSDRDISASQMGNLSVWIRDQQPWGPYFSTYLLDADTVAPVGEPLKSNQTPNDTQIDLVGTSSSPVKDGNGAVQTTGVVFRAGTVTLVTTDPDCAKYTYKELNSPTYGYTGKANFPASTNPSGGSLPDLGKVFVCPVTSGSRLYTGKITATDGSVTSQGGIELGGNYLLTTPYTGTEVSLVNSQGYFDVVRGAITKTGGPGYYLYTNTDKFQNVQGNFNDFSFGSSMMGNVADAGGPSPAATVSQLGDPRTNNEQLMVSVASATADGTRFVPASRTLGSPNYTGFQPETTSSAVPGPGWPDYYKLPGSGTAHPSPDATTAPAVVAGTVAADGPLTSVGQLGDVFDPARAPGTDIRYSHGGGRTFKIGQHDDLYSDDPTTNAYPAGNSTTNSADNVAASSNWASWRLVDIFDMDDPIQLPGRININGVMRDNGAALLSALQNFAFQPTTTTDPIIHGDGASGLASKSLDTTGASNGFAALFQQMKLRLDAKNISRVKPFFERGEFGELGGGTNTPLFGVTPISTNTSTNNLLVSGVDMNRTTDHGREEMLRRLSQLICTRGNTFTVYAVGQSIVQTSTGGPKKITGTQRLRVTFRLVPKAKDSTGAVVEFHPAYVINADGSFARNTFDPGHPAQSPPAGSNGAIGVIPRFAKPDRYDAQILEAVSY